MRKVAVLAVLALCLTGCVTARLSSGLQKQMGQPIDVLVSAWGYPADQRKMLGHTLYIWSNDGGAMAVPIYGGGVFAARLTCTVQVAVDDMNDITGFQWSGNNGGCAPFARRIPH